MDARVYLDYAATAPLHPVAASVLDEFLPRTQNYFAHNANANSLHSEGRAAFALLEQARKMLADILHVRPFELVFCSGATEADNAVLWGVLRAQKQYGTKPLHIVTTTIEHDAVFQAAKNLESLGLASISYVAPTKSGHIDPKDIELACTPDTVLVSVIAAHNETGAINDIAAIGAVAHAHGALFHTDAVQPFGKVPLDFSALPVDLASFSAHKLGGPKGVGLLYVKSQTPFKPFILGGGQENGLRSGTQNVSGAHAFAQVAQATCSEDALLHEAARLRSLRDKLYTQLCTFNGVHATVPCSAESLEYLPHIVNVCIDGIESETLILQLDLAGFAVSGGSACSSHSLEPSRSLLEIGIPHDRALCSLRLSMGWTTTEKDIDRLLAACSTIISEFAK